MTRERCQKRGGPATAKRPTRSEPLPPQPMQCDGLEQVNRELAELATDSRQRQTTFDFEDEPKAKAQNGPHKTKARRVKHAAHNVDPLAIFSWIAPDDDEFAELMGASEVTRAVSNDETAAGASQSTHPGRVSRAGRSKQTPDPAERAKGPRVQSAQRRRQANVRPRQTKPTTQETAP